MACTLHPHLAPFFTQPHLNVYNLCTLYACLMPVVDLNYKFWTQGIKRREARGGEGGDRPYLLPQPPSNTHAHLKLGKGHTRIRGVPSRPIQPLPKPTFAAQTQPFSLVPFLSKSDRCLVLLMATLVAGLCAHHLGALSVSGGSCYGAGSASLSCFKCWTAVHLGEQRLGLIAGCVPGAGSRGCTMLRAHAHASTRLYSIACTSVHHQPASRWNVHSMSLHQGTGTLSVALGSCLGVVGGPPTPPNPSSIFATWPIFRFCHSNTARM